MEFVGKLIQDLPMEEGTSRAGNPWRKKTWVAETFGQYPRSVALMAMNATIDNLHLELGKTYNFYVDLDSREFNGRWYTDVRVYRAIEAQDPSQQFAQQPAAQPFQPAAQPFQGAAPVAPAPAPAADPFGGAAGATAFENSSDDLPF